jgi:hypothetical protein
MPRGPGRGRARLRARIRLRAAPPRSGQPSARTVTPPMPPAASSASTCSRISHWTSRATTSGRVTCSNRGNGPTAPCPGPRGSPHPEHRGGAVEAESDDALLAQLAEHGADSGTPAARSGPAFGALHQGPDLHADRGNGGGAHDVAAGDPPAGSGTGTTATRGSATRRSRCRHCTS